MAFLSNRNRCVTMNGKRSRQTRVISGAIQVSVLGPLLITLYDNDLPSKRKCSVIKLVADDMKAYKCIRSADDRVFLQTSLDKIYIWAARWRLELSVEKSCYLYISYSNCMLVYKLNGQSISPCEYLYDLGIKVNSNFKPGQHCTTIISKANACSNIILRTFLSRDPFFN